MNGMMTEQEWRHAQRRRKRSRAWGAQCVMSRGATLRADKAFRVFLLVTALTVSGLMPLLAPRRVRHEFPHAQAVEATAPAVRAVSAIAYGMPSGLACEQRVYTREQLTRGKLLLLDAAHPLPPSAPAPNTHSVAVYGKGNVPANGFQARAGAAVIDALAGLFAQMRAEGVNGLTVWRGTVSAAELTAERHARLSELCARMPLDEAAAQAWRDVPAVCERQQEYTVELRLSVANSSQPDERPLEATPQGRALLRTAWRYGFIRCAETGARAYAFRYVGKAHAMAMTYLDLALPDYLEWLHLQQAMVISEGGRPRWLMLCEPAEGSHVAFSVPVGAECEVSLDNTGYAVAVCTLPQTVEKSR